MLGAAAAVQGAASAAVYCYLNNQRELSESSNYLVKAIDIGVGVLSVIGANEVEESKIGTVPKILSVINNIVLTDIVARASLGLVGDLIDSISSTGMDALTYIGNYFSSDQGEL